MITPRMSLCATLLWSAAALADTGRHIDVVFADPAGAYGAWYADLERTAVAAGSAWLTHLAPGLPDATLTVSIGFASMPTATGRSLTTAYAGTHASGQNLWHQGAAHELLTGIDPNGSTADIEFTLGIDGYLQHELWFDPAPSLRTAAVPEGQTDAMSVLMHEFGHALGFNGWLDGGSALALSTFDAQVQWPAGGSGPRFAGPSAMALYGGPVPLTVGNYAHLGNDEPGAGANLLGDLMNGVSFARGARYEISALDLAMLSDMGLPMVTMAAAAPVPEPAAALLLLVGVPVLLLARRQLRS